MFKRKTKTDAARRHLSEKELSGLWYVLTRLYLMKPRYASAFLSYFSQDLAEQMPQVVHAAIEVHTSQHGPTALSDQETEHTLELTCAIVAVRRYREMSAYAGTFSIDTEKAIWCLIFVGAKVVEEFAADILKQVQNGIASALGEDHNLYFEFPDEIEKQRKWDTACANLIDKYDCGEIDESDFAEKALDILV